MELQKKQSASLPLELVGIDLKEMSEFLIEKHQFNVNDYQINLSELYSEVQEFIDLRYTYNIFESVELGSDLQSIIIDTVPVITGKKICRELKSAEGTALFICTAGEIGEKGNEIMKSGDYITGFLYHEFGNFIVEKGCDFLQDKIKIDVAQLGKNISNRYSPGYCGWDVAAQKSLFELICDNYTGVKLTDTCLMHPIKSVSGIIGIGKSIKFREYTCELCNMKNCVYRSVRRQAKKTQPQTS